MSSTPGASDSLPPRTSLRHPLPRAFLGLTFVTGLIDGVSYLGLGHVFSANMTGNVVLLGFGIAGGQHLPLIAPLISIAFFILGAGVGGWLARRSTHPLRHKFHLRCVLALEGGLTVAAAVVSAILHVHPGTVSAGIIIALLAVAMGIRNATVRKISIPDLTTTVLTLTITGLGADATLAGGDGSGTVRRLAAVGAMLIGALAGALLLKVGMTMTLACAAGCVAFTAAAYRYSGD